MKKLVLAAIMMLVPFSAFALDAMNDEAMDKLTAQEGVTITFENVVINQTASNTAWSDADGLATADTSAGSVFITQTGSTVTDISGSLTIDVATTEAALIVDGTTIGADTSFVKIGLPSVSQSAAAKTMTISLNSTAAAGTQVLGTLFQDAGSSSINPGAAIYIYAH